MSREKSSLNKIKIWIILGLIWLGSNIFDRLWLILDKSIPAWDQSNHLNKSLQYFYSLNSLELLNPEWWHNFWKISTKYPPLTYIIGAFFQKIFGLGNDQALLSNFLYSLILIISIYSIGKILFSTKVGLWSASLSVIFPRLYENRLQFLIDTPLVTFTIASFCCLTIWKYERNRSKKWLWSFVFGIFIGLALLTKQSTMFFLAVPLIWLVISYLWKQEWERIIQLIFSFLVSSLLWLPWYSTNWIYLFSTIRNSNDIPATYEGDPPLNTLSAWTFYWHDLPSATGFIPLVIPLVGLLLHLLRRFSKPEYSIGDKKDIESFQWLGIYLIGSYLICSAIFNKDSRYIMPYLPVLATLLGYCLNLWKGKWKFVKWITLILAIFSMTINLFPIPGMRILSSINSKALFYPYLGKEIPIDTVIKTAKQTTPYKIINLGVIANTDSINHNNVNYYGQLLDSQVYGRELGNKTTYLEEDKKSFEWFVTKTGDNGFARDYQLDFANKLDVDPQFKVIETWNMPDESLVKLYHRREGSIRVNKLNQSIDKVILNKIDIPNVVSSQSPIPVKYEWLGNWKDLQQGLVLLSWHNKNLDSNKIAWIHDHGIGQGMLWDNNQENSGFKIIENTAMLPIRHVENGEYILKGIYYNRVTHESYPINIPDITLTINNSSNPIPSPELDLSTQLRQASINLAQGISGLDIIFSKVSRFNQYDPIQDYLKQTETSLQYRLEKNIEDNSLEWNYALVLSQALQENSEETIKSLKQLIKLDQNNPYHYAYLAFVYLYDWQPQKAEMALKLAIEKNPDLKEFQLLKGISLLMQGNIIKGWKNLNLL
ncbi:MAG: PMT family glycosyltransferase, 4-amino-4-deoxy-L-arabinose transferase [Candidatus Atelocyanobacterium thalassa isolate SIO64986]|uniref:PMT family glycosyltransferase, 4-amino-4-deoxy-L-arabinose transferase n=1 Tax=Candidatus Atelocyanobacterium thalassa isolate SIO64986 TaxID=1527444 RepID=A0A086CGT9_9CHRO|nr:MAG: PMT family glycosyltransferase, 4-amino-4-deoxy-L-arabinose transferase [Candidatus Atelocyanobacterium thalassa isolate SIO64986]